MLFKCISGTELTDRRHTSKIKTAKKAKIVISTLNGGSLHDYGLSLASTFTLHSLLKTNFIADVIHFSAARTATKTAAV